MSCVNIKCKEFRDLIDKTGVSADNLEVIVHEYQNKEGNQGSFPTVEYVNSRLEKPNVVTSPSQVALWEQRYSAPLIFKDEEALNAAITEASNFYSRKAITSWRNTKGEYVMRVGRPQLEDSVGLATSYNILREESPKDALLRTLDKERLIHRHNTGEDYALTLNPRVSYGSQEDLDSSKSRETQISEAYQKVQNRLERLGFPIDTITITPTKAGGTAIVEVNEEVLSQIQDAVVSGAKVEDTKAIHDLADFLGRTFGVEFGGIISAKKANELTGNADPNAFIQDNKVYVVANRVSIDTVAEEFLHPFINTLYNEEPALFNSLFEEASKLFPELKTRILSSYRGRKNLRFTSEDLKQELVAQALSRHFREEWEKSLREGRANTKETLKSLDAAEKFFTKAWKAIQRLLKTVEGKLYGKSVRLDSSDLKGMSLRQIAQLVNASDSSFWVDHNDKTRFSLGKASVKSYSGDIAPDDNTIFVFGSNPEGRHGAGAAKVAREQFGAKYGVGEGLTGNAYALPTKDLRVKENRSLRSISEEDIISSIKKLYEVALQHPSKEFKVAYRNTNTVSLNGYTGLEMIDMFLSAGPIPSNILFSEEWVATGKFEEDAEVIDVTEQASAPEDTNEAFAKESQSLTSQIDNLLDSNIISATEVRHLAEQAVYWISDHITELQENPDLIVKIYGEGLKGFDVEGATRAEIVKAIGPNNIIALCKEKFTPGEGKYAKRSTNRKARLIVDNWGALMRLASDVFANVEDFAIVGTEVREEINADADNFNESNNQDDIAETEGDTQEHWQVETRTLDVLSSMSQLVRQALTKCYILEATTDDEGNITYDKVRSEFGINERVNARDATNSILRWTQGSLTLEDMVTKLQMKTSSHPWVIQLIERLTDNSGKETGFQSQFFGVFCKHFQSYNVVIKENGEYKSIQVNEFPALREAVTSVTTQYKIGEHPMFGPEGVNKGTFQEFKSVYEELAPLRSKLDSADQEEVARKLAFASNTLGYYITPDIVKGALEPKAFRKMIDAMGYMVKSIEGNLDNKNYNPFEFKAEGSIGGNLRSFLQPLTDQLEDTAVSSFYDSGKMYQSYVTPSYMSKLMNKFRLEGDEFDAFIMDEYGKYEWFKHQTGAIETGWRNAWLWELVRDESAREIFKHKVQLNFNKHNYMRNMSDTEYTLSLFTEYFSEEESAKQERVPAWFRVPMLSNKPSSEFIRFYSERGVNYKETITNGLKKIFDQELSRIQTVEMRGFEGGDQKFIKNFDKNGRKFNFLDFMNVYLTGNMKGSELGKLIRAKLNGEKVDEITLNTLAKKVIYDAMEAKAKAIVDKWIDNGIMEGAKQIANIGKEDSEVIDKLTNFVWNDTFASMNIMQMTVTDIAYYKDAEDLQKRLAQIHAPGVRGNVAATDYDGNRVTDGYERTFYLTDFADFRSNIIENLNIVFQRKIDTAKTKQERAVLVALKDSLTKTPVYNEKGEEIEEGGSFWYINVADAQGYSSPASYRKKAFVFGKWSRRAEEIYQKLKSGEYTYSDLQVAFQPLKPFVYTQISKPANAEGAPITNLKVAIQNKNSEYLLIMADAILQGEDTGRPNLLRAVYEVMEESVKSDSTKGIDTVQFESTVKSGLMGAIDIKQFQYAEDGEVKAKAAMRAAIYADGKGGEYNSSTVHEIPFEDYCLQQEVPPHFKNHEQAHGSQVRFIIPSDLEEVNYLGEKVTYEVEGRQLTAEEFKVEYEQTIAANIEESINTLSEELHLSGSLKDRNIALSKILQREILSSPRYGVDLLQACSVDEEGNFRIPLGDPIQSKRVEQLINSIIKNRVNKQTIAGGPVVQVSNFGTSRELNIRFRNRAGGLLKTRAEFKGTDEEFKNYIKGNQAGIAYFEVFAPIYTNEIFTKFQNPDGSIDMEAIEALHPDLLKMVGYRIPTEDKYSMAPLKIVGFLPREAGDGIMLPNDITLLTGSDFDVDKEYLMRKEIPIKVRPRKEIFERMYQKLVDSKVGATYKDKQMIKENLNMFLDNPQIMRNLDALYQYMWKLYKREAYVAEPPTSGRTYRNNKIVEMTYSVLTHETTADKMLNPGGFEPQRRMGYLVAAFKNPANKHLSWEELSTLKTSELKEKCYTDKNLSFIDTHVQFYKQNSAAGALIGMFAVHKVAHAVLESDGYMLNIDNICSLKEPFIIADMEFGGDMVFDAKYDRNGQLIGKTLGCLVASAVDAVKDPVLNLMNINGSTATYLNALVRMGMPFDDAALFLSQSAITEVLSRYNRENITSFTRLGDVISSRLKDLEDSFEINYSSQLNSEPLTKEELVEGIRPGVKPEIEYKVLRALQRVQKISEALRGPSFATRFNSISSAVGPLIIDNLIIEHKMQQFSDNVLGPNGESIDITDILRRHPVLGQFSRTVNMAKHIFQGMPANSTGFRNILDSMTEEMSNIIYSDRKLLSSLSDFYQSYLMIASGAAEEGQLVNYINGFPTWFFKQGFKEKYRDNALIQAIKLDVNKETGRATLKVDTTGLDPQQKEVLSSAWIDLHKLDPDLSTKLFMYNFFRTGIGFSPKTFMGLVPTYVKERIPSYLESYRILPSVSPALVLDQFIRNNWDNSKLVPKKIVKYAMHGETLEIYMAEEVKEVSKVPYFRMKNKGSDTLWRQVSKTETAVYYEEISPLGNNGEYLEMSTSNIVKAKEIPAIAKEQAQEGQISEVSNQETDAEIPASTTPQESDIVELIYQVLENGKTVTSREQAIAKAAEFKSKSEAEKRSLESGMKKYIRNRLEKLGLSYNSAKIDEVYKVMC